MRRKNGILAFMTVALILAASSTLGAQGIAGRELLGIRVGGTIASGALQDAFGNGSILELHFIKGLTPWLGVDVTLSSHSFGASKSSQKNIEFLGYDQEVDLHFWSVDVGMIVLKPLRGRIIPTLEAGPGLYSVNTVVPEGFYDLQNADNRVGIYGGAGLFIRLTKGVSFNLNGKYHHVFIGNKRDDTVHFYTGEKSARFYDITIGIAIFTG